MQLVYSPASPFVRKVNVIIHETGLKDKIELLSVQTNALASAKTARDANPLGKIPTLLLEDGTKIFDSRVICQYINAKTNSTLYPRKRLWEILTLEALSDGIMDAAVLIVYESRLRQDAKRSKDWVEAQWLKITQSLDELEKKCFEAILGDLNMGQLALACALGYLDFRHKNGNWRHGRKFLASWNEDIQKRASLISTIPTN